jgi:signal transduction histidine kinase
MKHYLKQCMVWATALKRKLRRSPFEVARIRLTIFYTTITMAIIVLFSVALIISLERNTRMVVADQFMIPGELTIVTSAIPRQDFEARESTLPPQEFRLPRMHPGPSMNRFLVFRRTVDDLERSIVVADGMLLFLVALLGYIIAGRTLRPIQENVNIQKRFLADASHDLRTPLAIMKSESQVLLQTGSRDHVEFKEVIESNLEEIDKMSRLVDDLLIMARTEEIPNKTAFADVQVGELLQKAAKKIVARASQKHIDFSYELITDGVIRGEQYQLERAVQNILQNALNYTPDGGKITLSSTQKGDSYHITVKDTGVGISPKDLPHIFDRFYKASHSRNEESGSGLGLPIVRQIIERHGGLVTIESEEGVGTVVHIRLPIA